MKYIFHPEALNEYSEAVQYYAGQDVKLAQAFIDSVENAIYRLRDSPNRYPAIDEDIRRCLTRKFPYGISKGIHKGMPRQDCLFFNRGPISMSLHR